MFIQIKLYCKRFLIILALLMITGTLCFIKPIKVKATVKTDFAAMYSYGVFYSKHPDLSSRALQYRIYVPKNYNSSISYPLVLSLHGSGERGTDNKSQVSNPFAITTQLLQKPNIAKYPCIILAPQSPNGLWSTAPNQYKNNSFHLNNCVITPELKMTVELVNEICTKYNVDKNRLYVTGYSSGGTGTWEAILRYPDLFAAAVPISGAGDPSKASLIKHVAVWVFHNSGDTIVSVKGSRDMVSALKAEKAKVHYTEYQKKGHISWIDTYASADLYAWLFRQDKLGELPPVPDVSPATSTNSKANTNRTSQSVVETNVVQKTSFSDLNRNDPSVPQTRFLQKHNSKDWFHRI
jgi:Predicted peptidase